MLHWKKAVANNLHKDHLSAQIPRSVVMIA